MTPEKAKKYLECFVGKRPSLKLISEKRVNLRNYILTD